MSFCAVSYTATPSPVLITPSFFDPAFEGSQAWPSLNTYKNYEVTLRYFGTVEDEEKFEYFSHIKIDSDKERVSQHIYENASLTRLMQVQMLDFRAPHPIF